MKGGSKTERLAPAAGETARAQPLVLVVDDDVALQLLARESLEQGHFAVEDATDGDVALEAFSRLRPDIVLLDVNLPKADGFTVCSRLRQTPEGANTPVVMMTAADDVDAIHAAYDAGATDFITKPLNWVLLGYRLQYVLRASRTRQRLAVSEARLARAQQIARLGDLDLDLATGATSSSVEARRIFGLDTDGARVDGDAFWGRIHPDDRDTLTSALEATAPDTTARLDLRVVLPDGEDRVAHFRAEVIRDDHDRPRRVVATVQDVSERTRLETQLRQAQKMEAVGKLAGGIAHDFNNLLSIISGRCEYFLDSLPDDAPARRDVDVILQASGRAAALIRQLLAFSRQQVLERTALDLNALVIGLDGLVRQLIGAQIAPVVELTPNLALASADRTQMEQVILNLIVNARDAMPDGGQLSISTANVDLDAAFVRRHPGSPSGRHVALAVQDTGVGMDAAVRARIFEPFFTTKGPAKGTGLGLATVYGIVKQHGGYIEVESEPGRGSRFTMYLAAIVSGAHGGEPAPAGPAGEDAETGRLADDNRQAAERALQVPGESGDTMIGARNGRPAFDLAGAPPRHTDLVSTGAATPETSGAAPGAGDTASDRKRILVVDDNVDLAVVVTEYLERCKGWTVRVAHTGCDALKILRETPIAVALFDLGLPDIDGMTVIREIKGLDPHPDIVIMTGQASLDSAIEAVAAGAAGYLVKPCDLAEIGRLIERLLERRGLNQMAQAQKMEAIGQLAAGVAHEINTPIQFVGDNTQFLQKAFADLQRLLRAYQTLKAAAEEGPVQPEVLEAALAAEREAEIDYTLAEIPRAIEETLDGLSRVASIVRALKEFAHPDRQELVPADINQAILNTLTMARNEIKYVADVETEFDELPPVMCHLGELSQVFLNIIVNAAHAIADAVNGGGERGRITVRTVRDEDHVLVAIRDTGAGIPEAVRSRIFDPFFTTKDVGRGTGQGLTIARAVVVDKHGGSLTFETEVAHGTTFFIRLPIEGRRPTVSTT